MNPIRSKLNLDVVNGNHRRNKKYKYGIINLCRGGILFKI
jgi:hypothetical protein